MNMTLANNLLTINDDIDKYISSIYAIKNLSENEEITLAKQWFYEQDKKAAQQLVLAHLKFVVKIARSYLGYKLPLSDLIQEGNIGLMKAVKRFNPEVGVRLVTFSIYWIKAEIHEFIIKNWSIVKIATTKAQRKLFFKLRSYNKKLNNSALSNVEQKNIAKNLDVNEKDVKEMEKRLNFKDYLLGDEVNNNFNEETDSFNISKNYLIANEKNNPETALLTFDWQQNISKRLKQAIENLDERSKFIVLARWLNKDKMKLNEIAKRFTISSERVRQIEKQAMIKIRKFITNESNKTEYLVAIK